MRWIGILVCLVPALLGTILPAMSGTVSAQGPATLEDYRRAVDQALALVRQADAAAAQDRAPLLAQARAALEPIHSVELATNVSSMVDNAGLLSLMQDPDKTGAMLERLTALQTVLAQPPATIQLEDLTALHTILSRPPFATSTATWWQELVRRLLELLDRLFSNTANGVFDARDYLILLALGVVVFVVVYLVRNLRRNLVSEESLPPLAPGEQARTPTEAFDNAQRFIRAGDYRSAVRQLYLATLLTLDQKGKIKYDPTLTNRQVLHQASNDPRTSLSLAPIVETFDRVWYGFEPLSPDEFESYRQQVEKVRE